MLNSNGDKSNNSHIFPTGTHCSVVDFDVLQDGFLGVTVEGMHCVSIDTISTETDGLRIGECNKVEPWGCDVDLELLHPMNKRLEEIFDKYPEISSLYNELKFNDPIWVINRWIELLPVGAKQKQYFLEQQDCTKVIKYLNELIE